MPAMMIMAGICIALPCTSFDKATRDRLNDGYAEQRAVLGPEEGTFATNLLPHRQHQ